MFEIAFVGCVRGWWRLCRRCRGRFEARTMPLASLLSHPFSLFSALFILGPVAKTANTDKTTLLVIRRLWGGGDSFDSFLHSPLETLLDSLLDALLDSLDSLLMRFT